MGLPGGASGKEPACQCRRHKRCSFDPWVGTILWRRAWKLTPVFLPGEFHGQRNLAGYSPQGHKKSDTTEVTQHAHTHNDINLPKGKAWEREWKKWKFGGQKMHTIIYRLYIYIYMHMYIYIYIYRERERERERERMDKQQGPIVHLYYFYLFVKDHLIIFM